MGRSVSLFLMRAAGIACAGMLLFAVFGHAHAEDNDGSVYGLKPLPGGSESGASQDYGGLPPPSYSPAPLTAAYSPAPNYYAPQQAPATPGFAPAAPQAAMPMPAPMPMMAAAPDSMPYGYKSVAPTGPTPPNYGVAAAPVYQPQMPPQRLAMADTAPGAAPSQAPSYRLGSGDKVHLTVFDEPDLTGDYGVDGSGYVRLPLIGQIHAAGYNAQQLEGVIGSAFANGYLKSPRISVDVTTYRPFYIIGAVNRPGEYPYVNHMNALNAVALAGGFTPSAVESVLYVRREGSSQEVRMPTDGTTQIYPGDVVRVNNTFFWDAMNLFGPLTGAAGIAAAATIH